MNGSNLNDSNNLTVVCFGEVLWDNLPTGRKPGGAPMNVAYHLNKMEIYARPISKVGADQDGKDLLEVMRSLHIDTNFCYTDAQYKTSTVEVTFNAAGDAVYDIVFPVAWDFIDIQQGFEMAVKASDAFVFGSLAGRNDVSRNTLFQLLDSAKFRVFDINLRAPHYDQAYIQQLLDKTDLLKVNDQELEVIAGWYNHVGDEASMIDVLRKQTGIEEIVVTKGSQGASYFCQGKHYVQPAYKVTVKDTVGSGDSFLAAFLSGRLNNPESIKENLDFAAKVAGYITTRDGACPDYEIKDILSFHTGN